MHKNRPYFENSGHKLQQTWQFSRVTDIILYAIFYFINMNKYDCKDCEAIYFGESKRTIAERTKEHTRVVRAADTRRYETADHCWKYIHDFDWENKKIMDYETNTTTRKIKETIHSLSNDNHIWFPALKLKGGSEVNISSNQN